MDKFDQEEMARSAAGNRVDTLKKLVAVVH